MIYAIRIQDEGSDTDEEWVEEEEGEGEDKQDKEDAEQAMTAEVRDQPRGEQPRE